MKQYFLEAKVSLTKTFNNQKIYNPYPLVKNFSSHETNFDCLKNFYENLVAHSEASHCLLKGTLTKPLANEPRAGSTDPDTPTNWICLDFDGADTDPETFLNNVGLGNISYILQYSSSSGLKPGLHAHLFMLLEKEQSPQKLKTWLMKLNLENFKDGILLSKNYTALKWPLDISTCQNDKLLYIAPPIFLDNEDPIEQRIHYYPKDKDRIPNISVTPEKIRKQAHSILADLRKELNLDTPPARSLVNRRTNISTISDNVEITGGIKESNGFYHYNLNGGDSYGYYTPIDDPELIMNFKGEPFLKLSEVAPDQYREWMKKLSAQFVPEEDESPFFFYDMYKECYVLGVVGKWHNMLSSKEGAQIALTSRLGLPWPKNEAIPVIELIDDPTLPPGLQNDKFNVYIPTMQPTGTQDQCPPTISKLIQHIVAYDDICYRQFMMWLANFIIYKNRNLTAWLFHGTQGTGKGGFVSKVLKPLLGNNRAVIVHATEFKNGWNSFLKGQQLVMIDELSRHDITSGPIMGLLKHITGSDEILIKEKYIKEYVIRNFTNLIFNANTWESLKIEQDDRRFNIAPRQEIPILRSRHPQGPFEPSDWDNIQGELQEFLNYLAGIEVDQNLLLEPVRNDARQFMIEDNYTVEEAFVDAIVNGKLDFFLSGRPSMAQYQNHLMIKHEKAMTYDQFLKHCIKGWHESCPVVIDRKTLEHIYRVVAGTKYVGTGTQSIVNRLRKKGLSGFTSEYDGILGKTIYGIKIHNWVLMDPESFKSDLEILNEQTSAGASG